ncbi:MAG: hypothetical protein R3E09_00180 [Novosphingobium sp.]
MPREKQGIALREQVRCESFLGIIPWTIGANKAYIATWKTFFDWAEKKYDLLVDSSKITSRTVLRPFLYKKLGYDVLIIYLYKDPMDLLRSLAKGSNRSLESEGTRKGLPHLLILRSFLGAVFSYLATQFVARALKLPMQKVKYDSLVSDPGGVVKYFTGNHVEVDRTTELNSGHMVAGNRMARSPGGIFINPAANETGDIVVPGAYKYIFGFLDKIHRRARDRDFC